jgi:signal transduction histidine kinase/ActR/RegA family two-component response regulator
MSQEREMDPLPATAEELTQEIHGLRDRLREAEEMLHAIREGEVDAFVINEREGERIYNLVAGEDLFRSMLEQAADAIVVCDKDQVIVNASRAACDLCGESPVLRPFASVFPLIHAGPMLRRGEPRERRPFSLSAVLEGEGLQGIEVRIEDADCGEACDLLLSAGPLRDFNRSIVGCVVTLTNITQRRQAEDRLRLLAEAAVAPSESFDLWETMDTAASLVVPAFADWCVIDLVTDDGRLDRTVAAHADTDRLPAVLELKGLALATREPLGAPQVLRTGEPLLLPQLTREEVEGDSDEPAYRRLVAALAPRSALLMPLVARGRTIGVWSFFYSGADRRYGADDVALAQELARRAALAIDNARLYGEARAANEAKDQFLATLSHELRTPLAPVMAIVSSLERDARLPRDVRDSLTMVLRNVALEARLIDDLLDLTRISRGKLELERRAIDVRSVLEQALETCCAREIASGRMRVVQELTAEDHHVWADPGRLSQVFWNLFNNAVKFTPEKGTLYIRSWQESDPAASGERALVVEISDTGIGIRSDLLPQIFGAFDQGDQGTARRFGGLGLGLTISRAIMEMHGGSLAASSLGSGRGATFTVRIPVGAELVETAAARSGALGQLARQMSDEAGTPSVGSLDILLVEDHADTAQAMAALLEALGHRVTVAGTLAEARAAASRALRIDLVVSDLGLPDGNGQDLMRELARKHGLRGIALSGYGMEEDIRKSREAGFERHLTKPIDAEVFKAAIRQAIQARPARPASPDE